METKGFIEILTDLKNDIEGEEAALDRELEDLKERMEEARIKKVVFDRAAQRAPEGYKEEILQRFVPLDEEHKKLKALYDEKEKARNKFAGAMEFVLMDIESNIKKHGANA